MHARWSNLAFLHSHSMLPRTHMVFLFLLVFLIPGGRFNNIFVWRIRPPGIRKTRKNTHTHTHTQRNTLPCKRNGRITHTSNPPTRVLNPSRMTYRCPVCPWHSALAGALKCNLTTNNKLLYLRAQKPCERNDRTEKIQTHSLSSPFPVLVLSIIPVVIPLPLGCRWRQQSFLVPVLAIPMVPCSVMSFPSLLSRIVGISRITLNTVLPFIARWVVVWALLGKLL